MFNSHHLTRRTVLLGAAALGASTSFARTGKIVLGQSVPLSGPSAQVGIQFNQGAQLYFNHLNANGGVHGREIELDVADDGYEPERTLVNTKQFIKEDVFALFGYVGTPTSAVALPLATKAKIPFFAPLTGADILRRPLNRYALHIRASYSEETAALVQRLTNIGIQKVAVFYQNDAYGEAGFEGVQNALTMLRRAPVATGTVERNSLDVTAAVKTIVAAAPTAIVLVSTYQSCAAFIRAAKASGYKGTFYNVSFVGTEALGKELGKDAYGVVVSQVMPSPYSTAKAVSFEYINRVKEAGKIGATASYHGIEGFIAAKVFHEALKISRVSTSREAFIDAVESMKDVNLGGFSIDFGKNKHTASQFVELTMLGEDGKVLR